MSKTPYQQGYDDALAGKPGPDFPNSNSSWSERLYLRGWYAGHYQHPRVGEGASDGCRASMS